MLSKSVHPTPLRWIVTGVPGGPDVGEILTTEDSIAKNVRASVLSPDLIVSVCMPPRSSGICNGASSRPSGPTMGLARCCSFGAKPLPDTRLPACVPQMTETGAFAGNPLPLSSARVLTGPCAGVMLRLAPDRLISAAGIVCAGYGSTYPPAATDPGITWNTNRGLGRYAFGACS